MINKCASLGRYWISSITRLPTFIYPETILIAGMCGDTGEEFEPAHYRLWQGRDVKVLNGLHKYKLEITCDRGTTCSVVGLSDVEFSYQTIFKVDGRFFPIYIHCGADTFLFTKCISNLFNTFPINVSNMPVKSVMTPYTFVERISNLCCVDIVEQDQLFSEVCNIRQEWLLSELIATAQSGDIGGHIYESTYNDVVYPLAQSPFLDAIRELASLNSVSGIRRMLSPYGSIASDISEMCNRNFVTGVFDGVRAELNNANVIATYAQETPYSPVETSSVVANWLTGVFSIDASDFQVVLNNDGRECHDFYVKVTDVYRNFTDGFIIDNELRNRLANIPLGFRINNYGKNSLIVQRSWLEDIVLRDPTNNNIVLYIDLVYWVLAAAGCLINEANLVGIEFY